MHDLTSRIESVEEEILALRNALRYLREAFAEGDANRSRPADVVLLRPPARPLPPLRLGPQMAAPEPPEQIERALYSDSFVFLARSASGGRRSAS